jgi:hypothetical protein
MKEWIDREIEKCKWLLNEKLKRVERNSIMEYLKSLEKKDGK